MLIYCTVTARANRSLKPFVYFATLLHAELIFKLFVPLCSLFDICSCKSIWFMIIPVLCVEILNLHNMAAIYDCFHRKLYIVVTIWISYSFIKFRVVIGFNYIRLESSDTIVYYKLLTNCKQSALHIIIYL